MRRTEETQVNDGIAMVVRGDALLSLWNAPARLHRSRWVYDAADDLAARSSNGVVGLMILLPTADPPDGPTRRENAVRMPKLKDSLRRLVTVVLGDDLRQAIVRSVLRIMALPLGPGRLRVTSSLESGIAELVEAASPATPSFDELVEDVVSLFAAVGIQPPRSFTRGRG